MDTIEIAINPGHLNWPLPQVYVGELAAADFTLRYVPAALDNVRMLFTAPPVPATPGESETGTAASSEDPVVYVATGTKNADGTWSVYAPPLTFPRAGINLNYNVLADDDHDNPRWLGTGVLEVRECPAQGSPTPPPIVPKDTYIRNPATGKYHLLTASVDGDGNLTINLAAEGVDR